MQISNMNKYLIFIFIIILILFPKIAFSVNGVSDVHKYAHIVPAHMAINAEKINVYPFGDRGLYTLNEHVNEQSERMGMTSLQVILSIISGLPLKTLDFIPYISLILVFLSFIISKRIFASNYEAICIALFISYEPILNALTNMTMENGVGYVLYFTSIFFLLLINKSVGVVRALGILIYIIIFISSLFIYYTVEMYIIIMTSIFFIVINITNNIHFFKQHNYINNFRLPIILINIFLMYDNAVYRYLGNIGMVNDLYRKNLLYDFFYNLIYKIVNPTHESTQASTYISGIDNILVVWSGLLLYIAIIVPIIIYLIKFINNIYNSFMSKKEKSMDLDLNLLLFLGIIITGIIDFVIYAQIGFVSFKYILLAFPFMTFFSINNLITSSNLKKALIFLVVFLCIIKFGVYFNSNEIQDTSYRMSDSSTKWFIYKINDEQNILADLDIGGKLLIESAHHNKYNTIFMFVIFNNQSNSEFLYDYNLSKADTLFKDRSYDYLILTEYDFIQPFNGGAWNNFPPIKNKAIVDNYIIFINIYDDGRTYIYEFTN